MTGPRCKGGPRPYGAGDPMTSTEQTTLTDAGPPVGVVAEPMQSDCATSPGSKKVGPEEEALQVSTAGPQSPSLPPFTKIVPRTRLKLVGKASTCTWPPAVHESNWCGHFTLTLQRTGPESAEQLLLFAVAGAAFAAAGASRSDASAKARTRPHRRRTRRAINMGISSVYCQPNPAYQPSHIWRCRHKRPRSPRCTRCAGTRRRRTTP